jgi:hypothetical protein
MRNTLKEEDAKSCSATTEDSFHLRKQRGQNTVRANRQLILLQARLNDSGPSRFIFDTGAESSVIDSQLAKTLNPKAVGRTVGTGSAGTATADLQRNF